VNESANRGSSRLRLNPSESQLAITDGLTDAFTGSTIPNIQDQVLVSRCSPVDAWYWENRAKYRLGVMRG